MNETLYALFLFVGAIMAFIVINFYLDNIRKCYKVVGKSNFDRKDVPDVEMKRGMTWHDAQRYCDLMNEEITDLSKYYYFVEKQ